MHLSTVTEIALHINSFRNIELWYQGVYFLKFTIYHLTKNGNKIYAQPYALTETTLDSSIQKTYDSQIVGLSSIIKNESAFCTKAFHLRYFQQEVEIGDVCRWRFEVRTFQEKNEREEANCIELTVQVGLYFYDSFKKQLRETVSEWQGLAKEVRSIKFNIPFNTLEAPLINSYIPILFTDQYFSLTSSTIHLLTIDYKLRMNEVRLREFASWSEQERRKKLKKMMLMKHQMMGMNHHNEKRLSVESCFRLAFRVESQPQLIRQMIKLSQCLNHLKQLLIKQYTKVYNFSINQQFQFHVKIKPIPPSKFKLFCLKQTKAVDRLLVQQQKALSLNGQQILEFLNEISCLGQLNLQLFNQFIKLIKFNSTSSTKLYCHQYHLQQQQFYNKLLTIDYICPEKSRTTTKQCNWLTASMVDNNRNTKLRNQVQSLQKLKSNIKINTSIYDQRLYNKITQLPLLIIQSFVQHPFSAHPINNQAIINSRQNNNQSQPQGIHLIILVHGFQGTSYDMKLIKNNLSHLYPQSIFLCCTSNEERTDGDIFEMGTRLAVQIKGFIIENFTHINNNESELSLQRISFIGHSLGGLKIRAALPKLLQYKNMFYNFISLSSPHLGYNINTSTVIDAGLWMLQKLKDSQCLRQLKMIDSLNLYQSALYKLSLQQGLQHFKRVFLFSSIQDSYAPYSSARIQIDPHHVDDNDPLKTVNCEMVKNILKNVNKQVFHRVDVRFTINTKNIDSLIGRTAHIMFLQNSEVVRVFTSACPEIFL